MASRRLHRSDYKGDRYAELPATRTCQCDRKQPYQEEGADEPLCMKCGRSLSEPVVKALPLVRRRGMLR